MRNKKLVRAWARGKTRFPSVYGVKNKFAWDLLCMGDIEMSHTDLESLDLKYKNQLERITPEEAGKLLEKKGWKWIKIGPYIMI